ncbi:MAG: MFS transporter [Rhodocyclaceae bacterium]|nr:MFS transporter [Rhodocyclaceae bacterium]
MTDAPESSRAAGATWRLAAWYFAYFAFVGAFSPYFALYLADVGLSAWQIAILMVTPQVMRLLAPGFWGWLAARCGHSSQLTRFSALGACLAFAPFFITDVYAWMLVAMAFVWFFWSAALPLVETLTLEHLGGRVDRYGHIRLWGSVGFIASVLGLGVLLDYLPIRALLPACFVILAGVLAAALLLPNSPAASPKAALPGPGDPWQTPVLALLSASFFMAIAHGPLYVFYSLHLSLHGYDKTTTGLLWSLGVIAEILVFLAMPAIAARFSLRSILLASFLLAVIRFLLIGWYADSLLVLVFAQGMHAATFGAHHAAVVALLARWFRGPQLSRMQGLYGSLSFGAGGLLGGLMSGYAWDTIGPAGAYSLGAMAAAIGACLIWRGLTAEPNLKNAT